MKQIDRINNMNIDEKVDFYHDIFTCFIKCPAKKYCTNGLNINGKCCKKSIRFWLESEVETCESNKTQTE